MNKTVSQIPKISMHRLIDFFAYAVFFLAGSVSANTCYTDVERTVPPGTFTNNADGTVSDMRTGLMWSVCSEGQTWLSGSCAGVATTNTWADALDSANQHNTSVFLGYTDWRLPNRSELASILELSCVNPAIDLSVFPDTPNSSFWTSTPSIRPNDAFRVVFNYGNLTLASRTATNAVRLVRNQ